MPDQQQEHSSAPVDAWREKGATLSRARRLQQFEIADWLVEGTGLFPDATAAYDFAEKTFPDIARQTFINWVSVARQFPACMRIQSDWLTFSHYQVALRADGSLGAGNEKHDGGATVIQHARLQWLQQAHDNKMTVANLRLGVTNEWVLTHTPAQPPAEAAPAAAPAVAPPPVKKRTSFLETPVYQLLSAHTKGIQALASARRITPDMLVVDAISEYLAAHANELEDALIKDKEESERKFREMISAAKRAEQQARAMSQLYAERSSLRHGWNSLSGHFPDDEPAFAQGNVATCAEHLEAV
jgi:hypothetical protein